MEVYSVIIQDSSTFITVVMFTDHFTDGLPDQQLGSATYGPLPIEDGTTLFATLGIDHTETIIGVRMPKLVGSIGIIELDGLKSIEMTTE